MSYYQVLKSIQSGKFTVELHEQNHGCFEHNELGDECAGELWFEVIGGDTFLIDYDGVFALPAAVWKALEDSGIVVGEECKA